MIAGLTLDKCGWNACKLMRWILFRGIRLPAERHGSKPRLWQMKRPRWSSNGTIARGQVSCVTCHFSTILTIVMHQCGDRCHNSMHSYVNIVSQSVCHGSNVIFLGVLSNRVVTARFTMRAAAHHIYGKAWSDEYGTFYWFNKETGTYTACCYTFLQQ